MRTVRNRLSQRLRRFGRSSDGAAAVEFALIVPIMLILYVGSVEVSLLIALDRKVQSAAGALGDLVARSDATITEASLADYFQAAAGIMTPYSTEPLQQVVTLVKVEADGTTNVEWSREYEGGRVVVGTTYPQNESYVLPGAMTAIANDNYVVVAEGSYAYPPLYGFAFDQTINLYRQNFFMPRFGERIAIE